VRQNLALSRLGIALGAAMVNPLIATLKLQSNGPS